MTSGQRCILLCSEMGANGEGAASPTLPNHFFQPISHVNLLLTYLLQNLKSQCFFSVTHRLSFLPHLVLHMPMSPSLSLLFWSPSLLLHPCGGSQEPTLCPQGQSHMVTLNSPPSSTFITCTIAHYLLGLLSPPPQSKEHMMTLVILLNLQSGGATTGWLFSINLELFNDVGESGGSHSDISIQIKCHSALAMWLLLQLTYMFHVVRHLQVCGQYYVLRS